LKEGDYIVVPRKIKGSNLSEINLVSELLKKLPEKYLDKIFVLGLKKGIFEDEFSRKSQKDYMRYWRDLIPLSWLKYKSVKIPAGAKLRFRWSKKTVPVRVPLSPTLMKLLGFFAAEGHLDKNRIEFYLGREERTIAEEIENCVQNLFGLNVKISSFKQHEIEVRVDGVLLPLIFKYVLDTGENAKNKKLPWIVLNCDEEAQKEFLKAYIIGDGNKRMREHLFEVVTVSNDLANGILYLATILGIPCTYWLQREKLRRFKNYTSICKKSYRLYFTTKGLTSLINLLPTEETGLRKIARFYKNILDYKGNKWKLSHTILNQKRLSFEVFRKNLRDDCKEDKILSPLKKLSNSEIGFLKIKRIKKVKYTHPFVYDLQVEGYEKFVGGLGPIFLHNSGTADRSECLMPVNLNIEEMKEVVEKTNGSIVWGGALHLAPADDIFIQAEYPLAIDPLLFPSIMSKKKAVGAKFLVIDIPCGRGAKIKTIGDANILAKDFIELGKKLEIKTQCAITHGEEPIGYMIGSALEAREALEVLMGRNNVADLIDKATDLAAILFRMVGKKYGKQTALKALSSRKAEKKLREIIEAQGGNPKIKPEDIEVGRYKFDIFSKKKGLLLWVNNTSLTTIARAAGAPKDKGAGIKIYKKIGDTVKEGEKLLTIYAEKARKLKRAEEVLKEEQIVDVGKRMEMLIHEVREMPVHKKMFVLER
ncbi:MAG: hypothetical protein QMD14_04755, partial [Candidatus Aenigmarchaeota archaeon]|nr:hypothetical protein [Candidatus Aenigmarchaeota archaeon]